MPRSTASFHLDRLVQDGLLAVEFRKLGEKAGPGSGRPAKMYRPALEEVGASVPDRSYDLAGELMATAIESSMTGGGGVREALADASYSRGHELGGSGRPWTKCSGAWLQPEPDAEGGIILMNCPFHRLADGHADVVCAMNGAFLRVPPLPVGCRRRRWWRTGRPGGAAPGSGPESAAETRRLEFKRACLPRSCRHHAHLCRSPGRPDARAVPDRQPVVPARLRPPGEALRGGCAGNSCRGGRRPSVGGHFHLGRHRSGQPGRQGPVLVPAGEDPRRRRILCSAVEHHAVLDTVEWLERHEGAEIPWLPVDQEGVLDLEALQAELRVSPRPLPW